MLRVLMLGLGSLVVAGCSDRGVHDIPVAEAYGRLVNGDVKEMVLAQQCGILLSIRPEGVPGQAVTWRVFSSGREMVSFTANLMADDGGTRVGIDVSKQADGREEYDGDQSYPRPAFRQPLRPAIEELIAALLEGRAYEPEAVARTNEGNHACNVQRAGLERGRPFSVDDVYGSQ